MGGKSRLPPPPDYGPVAASNVEAARIQREIAAEQLTWARDQYAQDREVTDRVLGVLLPQMEAESAAGAALRGRYDSVFRPIEDRFIQDAAGYDTPARREAEAARAMADVTQAMDQQRESAFARLASFGIDPSAARAGALDAAVRTTQGALAAGAGNEARRQVENTGRALVGESINIGRGYPGQIAQAYQTSQQAGQGGVGSQLATTASGAQTMGTGLQWTGQANNVLGNWGNQVAGMNNAYTTSFAQNNQSPWGTIAGSVFGLASGNVAGGSLLGRGLRAINLN